MAEMKAREPRYTPEYDPVILSDGPDGKDHGSWVDDDYLKVKVRPTIHQLAMRTKIQQLLSFTHFSDFSMTADLKLNNGPMHRGQIAPVLIKAGHR